MTDRLCSKCHNNERDRPDQRYCRDCRNAYKRDRNARLNAAMALCKSAGLTVVATEGGHAQAPAIRTKND